MFYVVNLYRVMLESLISIAQAVACRMRALELSERIDIL